MHDFKYISVSVANGNSYSLTIIDNGVSSLCTSRIKVSAYQQNEINSYFINYTVFSLPDVVNSVGTIMYIGVEVGSQADTYSIEFKNY